jgi:hypothetical protein
MLSRRACLAAAALPVLTMARGASAYQVAAVPPEVGVVDVYSEPSCGCCTAWMRHLEAYGFKTRGHERSATELARLKERFGLSEGLTSCHTAFVNGYVIEGHVPAVDVRRLVESKLPAVGLVVPGSPAGAPGIDGAGRTDARFKVLILRQDGLARVFASY